MDEPALVVLWERLVGEVLDRTQGFPKAVRVSFAARVDARALDVLELLVRARWAPPAARADLLAAADAHLAVLRTLLRLAADRRYLDLGGLEHLMVGIDEAGRMLGGWRRHLDQR